MPPNYIKGDTKRCNGPLCLGKYVPLRFFYIHRTGIRAGKPFSRCRACWVYAKYGRTNPTGLVSYRTVKFIFDELAIRLGKQETMSRLGVSHNFYFRAKHEPGKSVRMATVAKAMMLLKDCRQNEIVRHKLSIRYGAKARGKPEREIPKFNSRQNGFKPWYERVS